jgi:hypothetical protein
MAHYLVSAVPRADRVQELEARLAADEFVSLRPLVTHCLDRYAMRAAAPMASSFGRKRTTADLRSPRSVQQFWMTTSTSLRSSACGEERAGRGSSRCRPCFLR